MSVIYSPATRLLTALELLQARPGLTASELSERLEVNGRSVRRYITMLQSWGIPIEATRGRYGGYRLRPGFKLPPLMFTDDEAIAVTLGLLAASRMGLDGATAAVGGALAKIERVLPLALRDRAQALRETVALEPPPAERADARWLALFSSAAYAGRSVAMTYRAQSGEETRRRLNPYGLLQRQGRWYVVGHCHLRGAARIFRLDRVEEAKTLEEEFTRPQDFDCLSFAIATFAAIPDRWLIEVTLRTTLDAARSSVAPDFATLEECAEGVKLRAYDSDLDHSARFLASLGCSFQVSGPPELRDGLRRLAETLLGAAEAEVLT